jgi:CubicO group peptidase (beta-lactamase class C family)
VLERATGKRYEELLRERLLAPLEMTDSGIQPSASQEARLAPGYWPEDPEPVARPRWRFGQVCAFGGAFCSARDLARYASALLAAEDVGPFCEAARQILFTPVPDIGAGRRMAVGWFVDRLPGVGEVIGHGGEVDNYSSALALSRERRLGIVVLANRGADSAERVSRSLHAQVLPQLPSGSGRR